MKKLPFSKGIQVSQKHAMAMRNNEIMKQMKLIQIGLPEIPND
jgi:hypothetical protein